MNIGLTTHGRRELIIATILSACVCIIAAWRVSLGFWIAAGLAVLIWTWVLWFFRDPDRDVPDGDGLFVSPADGRVADITRLGPESPLGCDGVQIGIFMNVFNVHVNRAPCQGRIESVEHRPGAFLDVRKADAILKNESTTITMTHSSGRQEHPVIVRQIAGLVARRIVTALTPSQTVGRGDRIGMIKFGSRLELLVPDELVGEIHVQIGRRVKAGQTILLSAPEGTEA